MGILNNSPLEWPIRMLKLIPIVGKYYGVLNNAPSAYEHFYVGFIATLMTAVAVPYTKKALWFMLVVWVLHFVVKELIVDGYNKHWIRKFILKLDVPDAEMSGFAVDCIMRNAGFVFGIPFLIFTMWSVK